MKISAFITKTRPEERGDRFDLCYKMATELFDEVIVVDGEKTWPKEFDWTLIGEHFQRGYEEATGDWVFHLDTDFIFHEQDYSSVRKACETDAAALSFLKYQFVRPDRYLIKSRLILAVNKAKYGDRIKFNSGGDLCQPSLDGEYITPDHAVDTRIPFFNYEKTWKIESQVRDDVERMARAWTRHFGDTHLGTDETAYREWLKMVIGRGNKVSEQVSLSFHPKVVQDALLDIHPEQFGYDGFGNFDKNGYAV